MTYLTYAELPDAVNIDELIKRFASIEYIDDILSKTNAESRRQSLAALLLLAETLTLAGVDTKEITLRRAENGRPYADRRDLDFSLSHTKKAATCAVAVGENVRVGVDIEDVVAPERAEAVAKRFFSEGEREELNRQGVDIFAEIWTKKEALYKYLGKPTNAPKELDTIKREQEKFDNFGTEYGKIGLCRAKRESDEPKVVKIILKS